MKDTAGEIWEVVAVLQDAAKAGVDVGDLVERWRARALALEAAPAGAGWGWLAERGDAGAAAVVAYERSGCAGGVKGAQDPPDGGRPGS